MDAWCDLHFDGCMVRSALSELSNVAIVYSSFFSLFNAYILFEYHRNCCDKFSRVQILQAAKPSNIYAVYYPNCLHKSLLPTSRD